MSFGLSSRMVEGIRAVLARHGQVRRALIFGSRARGEHREGSDIDLCLVGDGLDQGELFAIGAELEDLDSPYRFDLVVLDEVVKPALREAISREGRALYESEAAAHG